MEVVFMKPDLSTPCYKCKGKEYIVTKERDSAGYQSVICKNCNFVMMKFSDNGTSVDIKMANKF